MKLINFMIMLLTVLLMGCSTASDNFFDDIDQNDVSGNPAVSLQGTKWVYEDGYTDVDIDYAHIAQWRYTIYFHSSTEAVIYWFSRDLETDYDPVVDNLLIHYKYTVNGNIINLTQLTEISHKAGYGIPDNILHLSKDNYLTDNDNNIYQKFAIDDDEWSWIKTIVGSTGDCRWYYCDYDDYDSVYRFYVYGNGKMADYTKVEDRPWHEYSISDVYIAEGVTSIGDLAFADMLICELSLPTTLTRIGYAAFANDCLGTVTLPDRLQTIDESAFFYNSDLVVDIPASLETIGVRAFYKCKIVNFKDNGCKLKRITSYSLAAESVNGIEYLGNLEAIDMLANIPCGTKYSPKKLVLPNSLKQIGGPAFDGYISSVTLGQNISELVGTPFFSTCTGIKKMYINRATPPNASNKIVNYPNEWYLYVPKGCLDAYKSATYWQDFKEIYETATLMP